MMNEGIFIGLMNNTALLLSLVLMFYIFLDHTERRSSMIKILIGLLIGLIGAAIMLTPWTYSEGVIFDTRSILLSTTGLFFGFVPTAFAVIITGVLRFYQGGGGVFMGIAVIVTSAGGGLLYRYYLEKSKKECGWLQLYIFGLLVHLVMLLCGLLLLPGEIVWKVLGRISLPVMLIYPVGTVLLGLMLKHQQDRKREMVQLRESEERWQFALEGSRDGVWDWDIKTGKVFFSKQWKAMIGYSIHEISDNLTEWEKRVHPDDKPKVMAVIEQHLNNELPYYESEYRFECKDGSYKWVLDRGKVIAWDDEKKPVRMIGTHSDISENKKIRQDLLLAKEKAEESDRLKSAFLANISHEIRTPMNGILGFADLLQEPDLTGDQQKRFIDIIGKSAARMLNIINNLIDISRIDTHQVSVHFNPINVHNILDYMQKLFLPDARQKGLEFICTLPPENNQLMLETDKEKLFAILTNLIKNAIKYTNTGFVETGYMIKGENIVFFAKDSGIGIPKDRQEAIFDRFVQADIEDKDAREGAGLGLSISKSYAALLGGSLTVASEEGKGSEFRLSLPLHQNTTSSAADKKPPLGQSRTGSAVKDMVVMIADDEEVSDYYLTEILKKECKTLLHASTGMAAVELLKNHPETHVILLDIKMPSLSGLEAAATIRKFNRDVIIIAQTAYAQPGDREKALEAGCNEYLTKPLRKQTLLLLLAEYSKSFR